MYQHHLFGAPRTAGWAGGGGGMLAGAHDLAIARALGDPMGAPLGDPLGGSLVGALSGSLGGGLTLLTGNLIS